jgi:3'-phosphoadenosine 5'-phosphosulfate sulfotransferase (PAPS reductase)/FAD synthetase
MTQNMTRIHCFFSGGRDSAVACYIAYQVAKQRDDWDYKLVHINTTVSMLATQQYVRQYAEWLGAELVIIRPEKTFKEYAIQHAIWPSLRPQRFRWCYFRLKLDPIVNYLKEHYKEGDIIVLGIKGSDSDFRRHRYTSVFFTRNYGRLKVKAWAPLLFTDDYTVERLIKRFGIPHSPVWHIGFSGECLCLAGAPLHEIAIILRHFPEEREMLLDIDHIIQQNRKSKRPAAPPSVHKAGFNTLTEFYEKAVKPQMTLDVFILPSYRGKSCQGSCML